MKQNILIIWASIFFIIYKFWLITISWDKRQLAPEPDDSYTYIGLIKLAYDNKLFEKIAGGGSPSLDNVMYIAFTYPYAVFAHLFNLTPEEVFRWGFYVGIIILVVALIFFFKQITKSNAKIAFLVFFLSFYNGSGVYHGFYWVVPSFYAFILFLMLFSQIFSKSRYWYVWSLVLSLLFVLSHPISVYTNLIFLFWIIILSILSKKIIWDKLKRVLFINFASAFWFLLSRNIYIKAGIRFDGEYSIGGIKRFVLEYLQNAINYFKGVLGIKEQITVTNSQNIPSTPQNLYTDVQVSNLEVIRLEYFNILFPHPIFIFIFLAMLFFLFHKKQQWLVALYAACLAFTLLSTITWMGYRALGYLWPFTFMVLAFAAYYLFEFATGLVSRRTRLSVLSLLSIGILGFLLFSTLLNYVWAKNLNVRNNISIDRNCVNYLSSNTAVDNKINYQGIVGYKVFTGLGLLNYQANLITQNFKPGEYLVKTFSIEQYYQPTNEIVNFMLSNTTRRNITNDQQVKGIAVEVDSPEIKLIKNCGDFSIYKIKEGKNEKS